VETAYGDTEKRVKRWTLEVLLQSKDLTRKYERKEESRKFEGGENVNRGGKGGIESKKGGEITHRVFGVLKNQVKRTKGGEVFSKGKVMTSGE